MAFLHFHTKIKFKSYYILNGNLYLTLFIQSIIIFQKVVYLVHRRGIPHSSKYILFFQQVMDFDLNTRNSKIEKEKEKRRQLAKQKLLREKKIQEQVKAKQQELEKEQAKRRQDALRVQHEVDIALSDKSE